MIENVETIKKWPSLQIKVNFKSETKGQALSLKVTKGQTLLLELVSETIRTWQ